MSGNFKVRCTHGVLPGTYFTTGKTYEVVDGKIVLDNGENSGHEINCLEDLDKHFASQFELLRNHSGEYISIKRCKKDKRVVAVMSVDGEYKKSANVKLKDFDGDFAKAAKAAVDKLVLIDSKRPETTVKVAPLYRIVKQDKYEMGDKVKIIDKSTGCTCDRLTKHYGNILTVKAFSGWNYDFEETSDKLPGKDIQGKVIEDNVKEETPLTADGFKVGDKVRLRKGLNVGQRYGTTTLMPFMVFDGTKIVKSVHEDDGDCILEFIYSKEMLELAENQTYSTPFDWTSFKSGKFAIHCDTEEKAKAFLKECDEHGIKWGNSKKPSDDFSWQSSYPCYHCNGSLFHDDINYCKNDIKIDIIPYATSTPTVKEVSRKAKVGEYIKLTASKAGGNAGDICKVDHLTKANDCGVYVILPTGETSLCICNKYYVVLEGYTPDVKPEVKEVKRHANPNDFIKIVRASGTNRKYKDGDILKVKYCHSTTAVTVYDFEFPGICDTEYVVLEDYVPEDKPTVIEVERPAKVGEWVKILSVDSFTEEDHKVGDIFQAIECIHGRSTNSAYYANRKDGCGYVDFEDYVVLENYTPNNTPVDSKPFKKAKVGDKIKVVKDNGDHWKQLTIGDIQTVDGTSGFSQEGVSTKEGYVFYDSDEEYIIFDSKETAPERTLLSEYTQEELIKELFNRQGM
jgi:hypothetical protein